MKKKTKMRKDGFSIRSLLLCVYVMCVKAFEAVMAGRPGNDSKSTSPIFSFLFIFFWIWDALSIHHTSANVPLSLYRGCCVQVLLRAKPPSRAVRNDRCVVRRSNVFFFKKIPIGQIEIFFFLFSRSVLIRRRTKNARAYCVLKTRQLFSHSPRKELNPPRWSSDSSAFLVHAQMDRWEFVWELLIILFFSRTAGLRLFGWASDSGPSGAFLMMTHTARCSHSSRTHFTYLFFIRRNTFK